ncbi:MAG: sensor histidine kinase [Dehalococcoidia bacterium]
MIRLKSKLWWLRIFAGLVLVGGVVGLALAPFIGKSLFAQLWGIEPLSYLGGLLVVAALGGTTLTYYLPRLLGRDEVEVDIDQQTAEKWGQLTQQYFELFNHDLGRPLRRILGKERELRLLLQSSESEMYTEVKGLLDEIESQTPSFRLMMSNIQVMVQLEAPNLPTKIQPVEPTELIRRIVDRYSLLAAEAHKEITWWSEPAEFGLIYCDGSAIEHIVTNLVDNTVRFATEHVEIKLTKNLTDFFVRVWDDGPGIPPHYAQHIFDRGWTPEVARNEEKTSSGLGLFIAHTLAKKYGGDLTLESISAPEPDHHTTFLLSLPLNGNATAVESS